MKLSRSLAILTSGLLSLTPLLAADSQQSVALAPKGERVEREMVREKAFAQLHDTKGTGDGPVTAGPKVGLGVALSAFAVVTEGFDYSGRGDVDYWMKVATDFGRSGVGLGRALQQLASTMGNGPLPAAVAGMGGQLTTLDWSGRGDAEYWMARARDLANRVTAVGGQLRAMAQACGPSDGTDVNLAAVLDGLAIVSESVNSGGRGDAEYWMRTTRDFSRLGRTIGRGLQAILPAAQGPLAVVLSGIASQFASLNEGGSGTVDFWMARAQGVSDQMRGLARSMHDIAHSL